MISIQCDGCYKTIKESAMNNPGEITVFSVEIIGISAARINTKVKTLHLCKECRTKRNTLYFENPLYIDPPEDAKSEHKTSQGN